VADPYTPVWIQLVGEKGESGQIQIKPGYGPNDKFEKDRIYKVVARVANIGRVSALGRNSLGQTLTAGNYTSEALTPNYEFVVCCVIIQTKAIDSFVCFRLLGCERWFYLKFFGSSQVCHH